MNIFLDLRDFLEMKLEIRLKLLLKCGPVPELNSKLKKTQFQLYEKCRLLNVGTFRAKKFQLQAPKALLGLFPVRNLSKKLLVDLISKLIDESEKSVKVENRQTDKRIIIKMKDEVQQWSLKSPVSFKG